MNVSSNLVQKSILFAAQHHYNQSYGKFPYIHHLFDVVNILYEYGYDDEEMIIAGWLHDVVEDSDITVDTIIEEFGEKVAKLVVAVTAKGKNRKEKKEFTLNQLGIYPKAIPLKMADRLANIRNCSKYNPRLLEMYKKEMPDYIEMFMRTNFKMTQEMFLLLM